MDSLSICYVLPVYNCCSYLSQTIESLLAQKHQDFVIRVVDDGSTDDIEFLREFYETNPKVMWSTNDKRLGAATCRNLMNSLVTENIIACCDAGDIYVPSRGELIQEFFQGEDDICYTHVQVSDVMGNVLGVQEATHWDGESKPPISHPTVAYRRYVTDSVIYHEDSLDTDFYEFFMLDSFNKGYEFGIIPRITCIKLDLSGSESYRDIPKSKREKFDKYKEYGIDIKSEMV